MNSARSLAIDIYQNRVSDQIRRSLFNPSIDQTIKLAVKSVNNIRRVHHLLSSSDFPRLRARSVTYYRDEYGFIARLRYRDALIRRGLTLTSLSRPRVFPDSARNHR